MTTQELRALLDRTLRSDAPHVEKLTVGAAVISEVLRECGMRATLVGGAQTLARLEVFGASIDERLLRERLRAEDAEDALEALVALARTHETVGAAELEAVLEALHRHRPPSNPDQ